MGNWSWLDFFIFLIFFLNTILGAARGASKEITSFLCLTVAIIFTIKFTVPITMFLDRAPSIQDVLSAQMVQNFMKAIGAGPLTVNMLREISYCIAMLICFVAIFSIGEATLTMVNFLEVVKFPYATLNRKVGGALGAVRGYILTLLFIIVLTHLFRENPIKDSVFVNLFQNSANVFDSIIYKQNVERYKDVYKDRNLFKDKDVYQTITQ